MPKSKQQQLNIIFRMDAHYRLLIAFIIGTMAFFLARHIPSVPAVALVTWIAIALSVIILDWIVILWVHPQKIRSIVSLEDSSRYVIFLFVLAASMLSLVAMVLLLKSTKGQDEGTVTFYILLSMGAVIVSWWLVHTVFTMRYAHLYYDTKADDGKKLNGGGLDFPGGTESPDYMDFVYFSFVLGMTFQVSDVEISSQRIRRLAWAHGLISFAFNTAIVALSINIISGMVSK